ncbi:restriction endonuclease subunit S [Paraburkholderia azotifigens]|uniref:Restriction endonuclease subunit S n=1 Tax=Paraburkholderia azotifigens TaxID=2057004 RepID=A0ABU9QVT2_9BURK
MSSEWRNSRLSDLGTFERGKSKHRPRDAAHLYGGPYPFIQTGDVAAAEGRITRFRQTYSEAGLAQSKLWPVGTLCITIAANIAETALLTFPACFPDSVVGYRTDSSKADVRFVEYLFRAFRDKVKSRAYGSVQENINLEVLRSLTFPVPPLPEQVKIAEFLARLDDRISLLRETNSTMEAVAQALFKSWFVDFEPVRARQEGRAPAGMDEDISALFPDGFDESELGLVPRGWTLATLGQLGEFQKGCSYKGEGLSDNNGAYMFNLGCFNAPRIFAFEKIKRYTADYKPRHSVAVGDLIIANTDMTQDRDILGRPLIIPGGFAPGFISHHVFKVVLNAPSLRNYLFFCFKTSVFRERAVGYATGTTVLALPKDAIEKHPLVVPDPKLIDVFNEVVGPILELIENNQRMVETLGSLRDALLPRLISGQLRLSEAETLVA